MGTCRRVLADAVHRLACAVLLASVAACGPHADYQAPAQIPDPPQAPDVALRFVPTSIDKALFEGDSSTIGVDAFAQQDFEGYVKVVVQAPTQAFRGTPGVETVDDGSYRFTFQTADGLAAGTHTGEIVVRICRDSACSAEHPGSPDVLPYRLTVTSHTNLTPLVPWEIGDWEMYQRTASHTGYVPVTLDAAKFQPRWIWRPTGDGVAAEPVAVSGGLVYASVGGWFGPVRLVALRESDRSVAWQYDFGSRPAINPPAVSGGKVFVATSGHSDTFMWSLAADSGGLLSQTPFASQWERYFAPTIYAGSVYTDGGYYGGAYAFDAATGANQWFAALNQYDEWTPAVDDDYVYAYIGESCSGCNNSGLNVIERATGTQLFRIYDSQFDWSGWSMELAPIIAAPGSVITLNGFNPWYGNDLIRFDIAGQAIAWTVPGNFSTQPALAGGVLYVGDAVSNSLQARDAATGTLLWSWPVPEADGTAPAHNVVVTDNLAFVSTASKVYAVNLSSHASTWSYPYGGALAISANGVLYVNRDDGAIGAINLQ